MAERIAYVDFETDAIEGRPHYPPAPVGVAVRHPSWKKSRYLAWGHPTGNNCSLTDAKHVLQDFYQDPKLKLSFHNGKFDLDVAETHLGLKIPPWERVHDTMVLAYLLDPHARKIGLKELAHKRLNLPPDERDAVRDWLVSHKIVTAANKKSWGAHISKAPGDVVGPYAIGDTDRTKLLLEDMLPDVLEQGMGGAYDRERRLIPVLLENERGGVHVDLPKLQADCRLYAKALEDSARMIYKLLGREFNLDSGEEVADALDKKYPGLEWPLTETGLRSTSKDSLDEVLTGRPPKLLALFQYHSSVQTCLRNFMDPWRLVAEQTGGIIHTSWNSVAQPEGGGSRTGRLSSSPNFQNIPTLKSVKFQRAIELYKAYLEKVGLPPLPQVRSYIVADSKSQVLLDRDFSQQELRVLAHFEDGDMLEEYRRNPQMDLHAYAAEVINENTGLSLTRKATKNVAFSLLYGSGIGSLAEGLGVSVIEAKRTKSAYLGTFPGVNAIQKDLKFKAANNQPLRTWGGRLYYVEPPKLIKGRMRTFEYKLLNYLIQGSSADITKEAWLRYHETKREGRLLLTVHDQILVSCPKKAWKSEMKILREAMEGIELDAPLTSDGEFGYRWTELEKCE